MGVQRLQPRRLVFLVTLVAAFFDKGESSNEIPHLQRSQRQLALAFKVSERKIIADSAEGYSSKQACEHGLDLVKGITNIPIVEDD